MAKAKKKSAAAADIDRVPVQAVDDPILSSPYDEPAEHWLYESGVPKKTAGRRRAGYYYTTKRTGSAETDLFAEENRDDLPLVNALREDVARWRGSGYRGSTQVTKDLLRHWHATDRFRRLFFCQLEAVETIIYLLEIRIPGQSRRTGFGNFQLSDADLRLLLNGERPRELGVIGDSEAFPTLCDQPSDPDWQSLRRLGCKMATGSGKTVVMAMTIAWAFCNRGRNPMSEAFPNGVLVCAPNLTVRNRLSVLRPEDPDNYYNAFDIVPVRYREYLQQGKVLVTNWHVFGLKSEHEEGGVSYQVVDKGQEDERAFTLDRLGELARRLPILVLNDEGHHCWRPKPGKEATAEGDNREEKARAKADIEEAKVWLDGLDRINNSGLAGTTESGRPRRAILATIDLSATPFYLGGSGYPEGAPFPWLVSDFGLVDAIESGIVKIPRLPVKQVSAGDAKGPTDAAGRPDPEYFRLWDHMVARMKPNDKAGRSGYKPESLFREAQSALATLYSQWKQRFQQYQDAVANQTSEVIPPAMIVVCPDTDTAQFFFERISGERTSGEGKDATTVYDQSDYPELKNEPDVTRTFRIDSKMLAALSSGEDGSKDEQVARMREIIDTIGKPGKPGEHIRCVVSVSMLTEGWDANNVTQILGVRPFRSQLLCEQVVGRGLRRRSYAVGPDGRLAPEYVDVYGIPFTLIPFKGREKDSEANDDDRPANHVHAVFEKAEHAIEVPRVENFTYELTDSGVRCDVDALSELVLDDMPVAVEVEAVRGYKDDVASSGLDDSGVERQDREAYYANIHPQRIAFTIAQRVTQRLIEAQKKKSELERVALTTRVFADVLGITNRFMTTKVRLKQGQRIEDLGFDKNLQRAVELLSAGIQTGFDGKHGTRILPVVNRMRPRLRSADVDERTVRPIHLITKSHLNAFAHRSKVEQQVATMLDWSPHVRSWLPNSRGFDLHLAYEHDANQRHYEPDFIVRLTTVDGGDRYLLMEVKGAKGEMWDEQAVQIKTEAGRRWCQALNNTGAYGEWSYHIVRHVSELDDLLPRMAGVAAEVYPFRSVEIRAADRWVKAVPRLPLEVAAGGFSDDQESLFAEDAIDWIEWDGMPTPAPGMFVARISGRSMEPKVPNGSWCLFRTDVTGSRDGRHLVVSHQDIVDPDFPMRVTLKRYRSEKIVDPDTGEWRHSRIVLEPLNSEYDPIELTAEAGDDGEGGLRVVAELVAVINES